jgi:hypothetical protein
MRVAVVKETVQQHRFNGGSVRIMVKKHLRKKSVYNCHKSVVETGYIFFGEKECRQTMRAGCGACSCRVYT